MADQYTLSAIEVGVESNEDCFVATLDSGDEAYVMLQRHRNFGSADDGGIYVEIGNQINANYGCVESCTVSGSQFSLRLTSPLLGVHKIVAEMSIPKSQRDAFLYMLQRIFTGHEALLQIETRP